MRPMLRAALWLLLCCAALFACQPPGSGNRLLLLLSVDTLRADRLGAYGSDRGLTPRIDALARDSQVFAAAYAPSSHTLPSMTTVLTGRYPEEVGVWSNEAIVPETVSTLAEAFQAAGWHTRAVVSNWVLRRAAGLHQGFEHYDDSLPRQEATRPVPERAGSDTTAAALAALDACTADGDRCFLWVHYQDPHGPYTPPGGAPAEYLRRERAAPDGRRRLPAMQSNFGSGGIPDYQVLGEEREVAVYRALYDAEIAYLDREVGQLLDGIEDRGLLSGAIIVFTADHGEALGEADYWFSHGEYLTDPLVRVPLLIRVPGTPSGRRDDVASLVDLHPTILGVALGQAPDLDRSGRSLLASGAAELASTAYLAALRGADTGRYGVVEGQFKYLVTRSDDIWHGRLLQRDDESVDLTAPAPHIAARMRVRLEQLMHKHQKLSTENLGPTPEDVRQQLRSLGYTDDPPAAAEAERR